MAEPLQPNWALFEEANRRGILPDDKKPLYEEAVSRGIAPQPAINKPNNAALFKELRNVNPDSIDEQYAFGLASLAQESLWGIRDDDGKATFGSPQEPRTLIKKLQNLLDPGRHQDVLSDYEKLIKLDPEQQLAEARKAEPVGSKLTEAVSFFEESVLKELTPGKPPALGQVPPELTEALKNVDPDMAAWFTDPVGEIDAESIGKLVLPSRPSQQAEIVEEEAAIRETAEATVRDKYKFSLLQKDFFRYKTLLESSLSGDSISWAKASANADEVDATWFSMLPQQEKPMATKLAWLLKNTSDSGVMAESAIKLFRSAATIGKGGWRFFFQRGADLGFGVEALFRPEEAGQVQLALDEMKKDDVLLESLDNRKFSERGFLAKGIVGTFENAPLIIALGVPGLREQIGPVLITSYMADEAERQFISDGMNPEVAAPLGLGVGILNTAIEKLQMDIVLGKNTLPFSRLLTKNMVTAFAGRVGTNITTEMFEEIMQSAVEESARQVGMGELDIQAMNATILETIEQSLPTLTVMGVIGAASGSIRDRNNREPLTDEVRGKINDVVPMDYEKIMSDISGTEKRMSDVLSENEDRARAEVMTDFRAAKSEKAKKAVLEDNMVENVDEAFEFLSDNMAAVEEEVTARKEVAKAELGKVSEAAPVELQEAAAQIGEAAGFDVVAFVDKLTNVEGDPNKVAQLVDNTVEVLNSFQDPATLVRHEAFHKFMEDTDILSEGQQEVLNSATEKLVSELAKAGIDTSIYEALEGDARTQEVLADAGAVLSQQELSLWGKAKDFFEKIKNFVSSKGFQSVRSILQSVEKEGLAKAATPAATTEARFARRAGEGVQPSTEAEVDTKFDAIMDEIFEAGFEEGRLQGEAASVAKAAKATIAKRVATEKSNAVKSRSSLTPSELSNSGVDVNAAFASKDIQVGIEAIRGPIKEAIRKQLVKEGVFTDRKVRYESDPIFKATYRQTMASILASQSKKLTWGPTRASIIAATEKLRTLTRMDAIDRNVNKIASKIDGGKVTQTNRQLREDFKKLTKPFKGPVKKRLEVGKRKMPASTQSWIRIANRVSTLKAETAERFVNNLNDFLNEGWAEDSEKTIALFKDLYATIPQAKDYKAMELQDQALLLSSNMQQNASLSSREVAEVAAAVDAMEKTIETGKQEVTTVAEERASRLRDIRGDIKTGVGTLRAGDFKKATNSFIGAALGLRSWFKLLTQGAETEVEEKVANERLAKLLRDVNRASQQQRLAEFGGHEAFMGALGEMYDSKSEAALADLNKARKEYSQYSRKGDNLSKLHLMQIIGMAEQQDYQEQAKSYDIAAMKGELSEADKALLNWFREWYRKELPSINATNERITGITLVTPDELYIPGQVERHGGLPETHKATVIQPQALRERQRHGNPISEDVTILDMWLQRLSQNEHYKAFADVGLDLRGVFAESELQKSIDNALGKKALDQLLAGVQDVINDGYNGKMDIKSVESLRKFFTYSKFFYNYRIGLKQLTSFPAFAFEIGLSELGTYMTNAFTAEGKAAMMEILNSDLAKERMGRGNTEEVRQTIGSITPTRMQAFFRRAMFFNKWGDIIPSMWIGQGIYRGFQADLRENSNLSEEAIKKEALSRTFEIIEATQQSSQIKDQAIWQRRGGTPGRVLTIFTNTTRQYLEQEFVTAARWFAQPTNKVRQAEAAKVVLLNHVVLPSMYYGMNLAINAFYGDTPDEDDVAPWIAAMLAGPASGYILVGTAFAALADGMAGGGRGFRGSTTAMDGLISDAKTVGAMMNAVATLEEEDFQKAADALLKSLLPPYREFRKIEQ